MKKKTYFPLFCLMLFISACKPQLPPESTLYMAGEIAGLQNDCSEKFLEEAFFGALYLSAKGHAIFNLSNASSDTIRYFWGDYHKAGDSIVLDLDHEYFYAGKWDARWDVPSPDYKNGQSRSVPTKHYILKQRICNKSNFAMTYPQRPLNTNTSGAGALLFFPYKESRDMKFYTWFYKQVPVLADL